MRGSNTYVPNNSLRWYLSSIFIICLSISLCSLRTFLVESFFPNRGILHEFFYVPCDFAMTIFFYFVWYFRFFLLLNLILFRWKFICFFSKDFSTHTHTINKKIERKICERNFSVCFFFFFFFFAPFDVSELWNPDEN